VLFNSALFIYVFLPLIFAGFFLLARFSQSIAAGWLTVGSIIFYGWWNPIYVPLLVGSVAFNYLAARWLLVSVQEIRSWILGAAIAVDLAVLGYFKYADFFLDNLGRISGLPLEPREIILPLGISFFTFTQIAFLVDTYRGIAREPRLLHYTLFVTYFPHLIAGPILHHSEMMPQFAEPKSYRLSSRSVAVGLTIFCIGLFKKVILADNIADFATPAFNAAAGGHPLSLLEAWGGTLAYALQLYFDFSGYSDMAIGISRLFGIRLPLNFNSPYKSASIIEFWRRWHMTLSRFLRDYLYFALGGNRSGSVRRYVNLLLTMVLGGLWHGAGWTFIAWGSLHGGFLVVNHAWRGFRHLVGWNVRSTWVTHAAAVATTFTMVLVGWVFFRASSLAAAAGILKGMVGYYGTVLPAGWKTSLPTTLVTLAASGGVTFGPTVFAGAAQVAWTGALLAIVLLCPNTQELTRFYEPAVDATVSPETRPALLTWCPSVGWAVAIAVITVASLASLDRVTPFLYFQF
jgi:D-alanyl-lipoteichoic acid acyltransferase DltB (MBOAT superfamily)